MKNKIFLNVLIIIYRSIRDFLKRILLIAILRNQEIDVTLIQESFLFKKVPIYFEGYKIYLNDNEIERRKCVALSINTRLEVDSQKINGKML